MPIKILDYEDTSNNNQNINELQRRFFLVDTVGSRNEDELNNGRPGKYIRYAKTIVINFELVRGKVDGSIYPPVITIDYDQISTIDRNADVTIIYHIQYYQNLIRQINTIWITVSVMILCFIIISFIKVGIWSRRSGGTLAIDPAVMFKFLMYLIGYFSNIFIFMTISVALFWLIAYKGQGVAFVVLPFYEQKGSFQALIIIGFFLKFFEVIHLIFVQTSYDLFFIDWERPKLGSNETKKNNLLPPINKTGTRENITGDQTSRENLIKNEKNTESILKHGGVSCWRTLFVANEWNELQTYRKVNPVTQLILTLLMLQVVNLEAITTADCNTKVNNDRNQYKGDYSDMLRVAMAASMYIGWGKFILIIDFF